MFTLKKLVKCNPFIYKLLSVSLLLIWPKICLGIVKVGEVDD